MREVVCALTIASSAIAGIAGVVALAACAEAPVDEIDGTVGETTDAKPQDEGTKLPPPSMPSATGSGSSSGTPPPPSDGGTTRKDSSASPPADSGGTSSTSCDPNDFEYFVKAFDELSKPAPRTCGKAGGSCKPTECCYDAYGVCVDN